MARLELESKIVKSADGTVIFAEACGDPSKQPVVFVHGFTCAGTVYDKLFGIAALQQNLFLVRYDMRGHGRSGKPETEEAYESIHYAQDFDAVCAAFSLDKPFYAGWSYGGSIPADICAAHDPVPVKGIVWLGALPYFGDILPIVATPYVLSLLPGICNTESTATALEARIEFCSGLVAPKYLPSVPFADMASWIGNASHLPPQCAKLLLARKQDPTRLKEEGARGLPLCIIHGSEDLMISADAVIREMGPHFKDLEVHILEGIGHFLFYEDPESVAKHLLGFIERVNRS